MYKLYHGDCLEIMKDIPDGSIDMVLCDLPYGITQNRWDSVIPLGDLWVEYNRVTKMNGAIVLTSAGLFTARLIMSNPSMFKYKWIWEKSKATNFLNAKKQPLRKHEDVCVFYLEQPNYNPQMRDGEPRMVGPYSLQRGATYGDYHKTQRNNEGKYYPTDMLYFKTAESEGKVLHSTQKPVALCEYLIKTYTNPGDTILDNCMGSGTTGVAAINTGRNFIGIELDDKYFGIAKERIENTSKEIA